jgi:hypothetical protein
LRFEHVVVRILSLGTVDGCLAHSMHWGMQSIGKGKVFEKGVGGGGMVVAVVVCSVQVDVGSLVSKSFSWLVIVRGIVVYPCLSSVPIFECGMAIVLQTMPVLVLPLFFLRGWRTQLFVFWFLFHSFVYREIHHILFQVSL